MKPTDLLDRIQYEGLTISLLPGDLLKVSPADKITDEIREKIRQQKNELIRHMLDRLSVPPTKTETLNEFNEKSNSEKPLSEDPLPRTWTEGNSFTCACGFPTGWQQEGKALCPLCFHDQQHGPDLVDDRLTPERYPAAGHLKKRIKPSPIALAWLSDHRHALDKAGWNRAEQYRRNKAKPGIAWLNLWDKAFTMAYLHEDGMIEFECSIHGRDFFQTARPAPVTVCCSDVEV